MNRPSCNQSLPDDSNFCPSCGSVLEALAVQDVNGTPPVDIAAVQVQFDSGMMEVKGFLGGHTGKVSRNLKICVKLVDAGNRTTASGGDVSIKLQVFQEGTLAGNPGPYGSGKKTLVNTSLKRESVLASVSDFLRGEDGALWWVYTLPTPVTVVQNEYVSGDVEVWFTPSGSRSKLHRKGRYICAAWE